MFWAHNRTFQRRCGESSVYTHTTYLHIYIHINHMCKFLGLYHFLIYGHVLIPRMDHIGWREIISLSLPHCCIKMKLDRIHIISFSRYLVHISSSPRGSFDMVATWLSFSLALLPFLLMSPDALEA